MKYENAAREEYRLLRAECFERHEEKMGAFFDQYDLTDLTWTERVALLKSEAENGKNLPNLNQKHSQQQKNSRKLGTIRGMTTKAQAHFK